MKFNLVLILALISANLFASGGDDAGNPNSSFLNRTPVNQYTCLLFSGKSTAEGKIERTGFARDYRYYLDEELPDPIPANYLTACHDFQRYGDVDSIEYPRLELKANSFSLFSRFDMRFETGSNGKKEIDSLIEEKLLKEFGITYVSDLFWKYNISQNSYGYILRPFRNTQTNTIYCPTTETIEVSPLAKVVTDFTGDTEGLYYGVMERQTLSDGVNIPRDIVTTMFVAETDLLKYGFYIRDGIKERVSNDSTLELKTIFFYYPFNEQDPLIKGNRKIVTIKFPAGNTFTKKLGCINKNNN